MCLNSDNMHSPAGPATSVRLHPQHTQCHKMSPSSIENWSVRHTGQFENRIDILGVINMIQIFTCLSAVTFLQSHNAPKYGTGNT